MREYPLIDCTEKYKSVMQFDKNKNVPVHRWYPFVEGYSKEFTEGILKELPFTPKCALEPFCGSGTTPVELQNHQIRCYSFEVSPFMHLLAKVKLERSYDVNTLAKYVKAVGMQLKHPMSDIRSVECVPFGNTVVWREGINKWNFHDSAIDGLLDVRNAINSQVDDERYKNLFSVVLASIILQCSNLFRNGKCLSYKKGWEYKVYSRDEVHGLFLEKLNTIILDDIQSIAKKDYSVHNSDYCFYGDVRKNIDNVPDGSLDLIITSPPYLNSRDYTDIYMLELKVLQLVNNYEELRALRNSTLRSHVQVPYGDVPPIDNARLQSCVVAMLKTKAKKWNPNIINMICGYFEDMELLFMAFSRKVRKVDIPADSRPPIPVILGHLC